ncbi:aquaporin-8-like [Alosa pseudoharengus]|uniref:aquaporin-8-like n=1 Tax=Alosa pseudoharengus TaxID=34774 RepID=UPI003F8B9101
MALLSAVIENSAGTGRELRRHGSRTPQARVENPAGTARLQPAVAHGLALSISTAITSESGAGGHMKPAVTLGVTVAGGLKLIMLFPYWAAQFCGAMLGAGFARAVASSHESFVNASGGAFDAIKADHQVGVALLAEVIMTFFLVLSVCLSAVNRQSKTPLVPFCIGILGAGAVSGGCLNPA